MTGARAILILTALFLFLSMAVAAPIPVLVDGAVVKKALKQYKAKRGETPARVGRSPKPSGYAVRGVTKRDDAALPKPSKGYRR